MLAPLGAQEARAYFAALDHRALLDMLAQLQHPERVPAVFAGRIYPSLNGALYTIN